MKSESSNGANSRRAIFLTPDLRLIVFQKNAIEMPAYQFDGQNEKQPAAKQILHQATFLSGVNFV